MGAPPNPFLLAADLLDPPPPAPSRWYCDRPDCDGEPHDDWAWDHARAAQRPPWMDNPDCQALIWLVMAGRGFGKTRSGAEWLAHEANLRPRTEWAILAPTFKDLKEICLEGESGLLQVLRDTGTLAQYNRSTLEVQLMNSAIIRSYSTGACSRPKPVRGMARRDRTKPVAVPRGVQKPEHGDP